MQAIDSPLTESCDLIFVCYPQCAGKQCPWHRMWHVIERSVRDQTREVKRRLERRNAHKGSYIHRSATCQSCAESASCTKGFPSTPSTTSGCGISSMSENITEHLRRLW